LQWFEDVHVQAVRIRIEQLLTVVGRFVVEHEGPRLLADPCNRLGWLSIYLPKLQNKREYPCLIFLDLCLPGMTGFEFLDQPRGGILLRRHVVFVISEASDDRTRKELSAGFVTA
jgi:CheY-like chemotaxis protein